MSHSTWRILSVSTIILFCSLQIQLVSAIRCYVCLPPRPTTADSAEMRKLFSADVVDVMPECSDYNRSKKDEFIQRCPASSSGCVTKFSGDKIMRTCSDVGRNECREDKSKGETLCYCRDNLCNNPDPKLPDPAFLQPKPNAQPRREGVARALQSGSKFNVATTDDEDLDGKGGHRSRGSHGVVSEGSGDGESDDDDEEGEYDTAYFDEYDEDEDANNNSNNSNNRKSTHANEDEEEEEEDDKRGQDEVGITEPTPFIVEEDISKWNERTELNSNHNNKLKKPSDDNDIGFDETPPSVKNVHDPKDRKPSSTSSPKRITSAAGAIGVSLLWTMVPLVVTCGRFL